MKYLPITTFKTPFGTELRALSANSVAVMSMCAKVEIHNLGLRDKPIFGISEPGIRQSDSATAQSPKEAQSF
jgi:hypothetical protein